MRLIIETVYEMFCRNRSILQKVSPAKPPIGHCIELDVICDNVTGITVDGNTRSETAILTIKWFVVFLSSLRLYTIMIMRAFPTKLENKIMESTRVKPILTEKE